MTAAVHDRDFVRRGAEKFGSQCIVVAIDAKTVSAGRWEIFTHGGRRPTGIDAVEYAKEVVALGAGEILLTSMDRDGAKSGFDIELTRTVSDAVSVPVIASGGVGTLEHLVEGVRDGDASAVLAASIFHFGEYSASARPRPIWRKPACRCGSIRRTFRARPSNDRNLHPSRSRGADRPARAVRRLTNPIPRAFWFRGPAGSRRNSAKRPSRPSSRPSKRIGTRLKLEAADVLYHLLVLLQDGGVSLQDVIDELARRTRQSGHQEKASRQS